MVIDGKNRTISHMAVNSGNQIGFIRSCTSKLVIKKLTFENADVTTFGSFARAVIGDQYGDVTLENVNVIGSLFKTTAERDIRIGGLMGCSPLHDSAKLALKNCVVGNTAFAGYHNTCGLVDSLVSYTEHRPLKAVGLRAAILHWEALFPSTIPLG